MKKYFVLGIAIVFAACSSPRYTYHFDHYDYESGRRKDISMQQGPAGESPVLLAEHDYVASQADAAPAGPGDVVISSASPESHHSRNYKAMTSAERKNFRKEIKSQVRQYAKAIKSGQATASVSATSELDDELKLAIIFGAVGITLTVLGGINTIFWVLGVAGLVIGLVFFIRWIQTQ